MDGIRKGERHTHKKRRKRLKQQARNYKPVPSLKAPKKNAWAG
jgi:hypothetical protein